MVYWFSGIIGLVGLLGLVGLMGLLVDWWFMMGFLVDCWFMVVYWWFSGIDSSLQRQFH